MTGSLNDTLRRSLLACGIVSSALYLVTIDVAAPLLFPQYHDYSSQMVSELIARGAPTRALTLVAFVPYNLLVLLFAGGLWLSAGRQLSLRVTAGALAAYGLTSSAGLLLAPMDLRAAGLTNQTVLHIWVTALQGVFIALVLVAGAFVHGTTFRRLSIATLVISVAFGAWTGQGAAYDAPWIGLTERISIYTWMLWLAALAMSLWQKPAHGKDGIGVGIRRTSMWTAAAVGALTVTLGAQSDRPSSSLPQRVAEMQYHFLDVTLIHEAIVRGDLDATLQPAARLSTMADPARTPESSARFVEGIRVAARRIVQAPTLENAAVEVTRMLRQCGSCHQSMSVFPAQRPRNRPDLGGIVGHMLQHQRALDDLLLGLVVPSDGRWREGAAALQTAELHPSDWPAGRELTTDVRRAEEVVHQIADEAVRATTPSDQGAAYGRLVLTCASCHSLHARIWGP